MKFLKSYPCQIEYIQQLPLDVLEDITIQIGDDSYLKNITARPIYRATLV
jgi:hypothetical protein